MQFIGIDSSRSRGRIAKSVLPSFLPANWGNGFRTGELNQSGPFASGLEARMSAKTSIDALMIPMCRIKTSAMLPLRFIEAVSPLLSHFVASSLMRRGLVTRFGLRPSPYCSFGFFKTKTLSPAPFT
jgi:hypothetical protein